MTATTRLITNLKNLEKAILPAAIWILSSTIGMSIEATMSAFLFLKVPFVGAYALICKALIDGPLSGKSALSRTLYGSAPRTRLSVKFIPFGGRTGSRSGVTLVSWDQRFFDQLRSSLRIAVDRRTGRRWESPQRGAVLVEPPHVRGVARLRTLADFNLRVVNMRQHLVPRSRISMMRGAEIEQASPL